MTTTASTTPWFVRGNYAPVDDEVTLTDLAVTGAIPPALDGLYVRNGPNPTRGTPGHWFFGDGMLHGIRIGGGKAHWYRNRYVDTARRAEPDAPMFDDEGNVDRIHSSANTNIVCHAGRLLAVEEGHFPYELDGRLETTGWTDFDGKLTTAFTAHPKLCPETGEMLAFGYGFMDPLLTYHRFAKDGTLVHSRDVPVAGPTMHHDFNSTRNHVIFMDLPVVFDMDLAMAGTMPYRWDDDYGARLVVLPREGDGEARTFEIDPCYVFHPVNAWEDGDTIHIDTARYGQMRSLENDGTTSPSTLHRWSIDLASGTVREATLDDRPIDFGRVPDASVGLAHRHAVATVSGGGALLSGRVVVYDTADGSAVEHDFGPSCHAGEVVFAADPDGASATDGWLVTYVHDDATDRTSFVILDASDVAGPAVASIELPRRIPYGFHGNWVPADALDEI